jgi:murein DD-endopeptidase MepM/ murein hydrolase activator NlpD
MKRLPPILLIILLLLTACSETTSLWGVASTPTSANPIYTTAAPFTADPALSTTSPTESTPSATPVILPTATPTLYVSPTPYPTRSDAPVLYYSQSGDTLPSLAARFGVEATEISSPKDLPPTALLDPGTLLIIPQRIEGEVSPNIQLLPDSEVIFAVTAADFNIEEFVKNAGGYLSTYREYLGSTGWTKGYEAIERLAFENSVNPRLLLALLEYESRWVYSQPVDEAHENYPMGFESQRYKGLFTQMVWAVNQVFKGYYGWRSGEITELTFADGTRLRLHPELNAGTVALYHYFAQRHTRIEWEQIISPDSLVSFTALYGQMFGDAWTRAQQAEPLFPPALGQPALVLPFEVNREWAYTGGPHGAWEHDGPLAAIDFAPSSDHGGCAETKTWILSSAPGLVVRSGNGVVVVDLDGDGREQTGWNLLYLHVATKDRVPEGTWVQTDDRIGHASCEGGVATGTHLHFARKYNGEWIVADGPIPFVIGGWTVHNGDKPYEGTMTRGSRVVIADPVGQSKSVIIRLPDE